ncbi:MAG: TraB/GumN family protein [Lachnospiraceae bacterium]
MNLKQILAKVLATGLVITMLIPGVSGNTAGELYPQITVSAKTVKQMNQLSREELITVKEAEYVSLYPSNWYKNRNEVITKKQMNHLAKSFHSLIKTFKFKKDSSFQKESVKGAMNRRNVLDTLYNTLGQYKMKKTFQKSKNGSVDFFTDRGILSTKKNLYLDKKCTIGQALYWTSALLYDVVDEYDVGSKGLFWKVQKGANTVYLLGSIHVGTTDLYPLSKKIRKAFREADELVVETDFTSESNLYKYYLASFYTDGTTLKQHLSSYQYQRVLKVCDKYGFSETDIQYYRPWALASALSSYIGSSSETDEEMLETSYYGIDNHFIDLAQAFDIEIGELETMEQHLDVYTSLTDAQQIEYLQYIVDEALQDNSQELTEEEKELEELYLNYMWYTWATGNLKRFKKLFTVPYEEPDVNTTYTSAVELVDSKMTGERDKNMAKKIGQFLDKRGTKTYFVVAGSAHFATDGLVIDMLKDAGYQVTRVK